MSKKKVKIEAPEQEAVMYIDKDDDNELWIEVHEMVHVMGRERNELQAACIILNEKQAHDLATRLSLMYGIVELSEISKGRPTAS